MSKQPARYVDICQDLYETGKFVSRDVKVEASKHLRNSKLPDPNKNTITVADWMLMATMREDKNWWYTEVDADSNDLALGVTTAGEMKEWTYEILGYDTVNHISTHGWGEFDAIKKAKEARDKGGVAFLMIHSDMAKQYCTSTIHSHTKDEPWMSYPDHWVSYLGNLQITYIDGIWDNDLIDFDIYSWGGTCPLKLGEGPFEDYMFGVVTGEDSIYK